MGRSLTLPSGSPLLEDLAAAGALVAPDETAEESVCRTLRVVVQRGDRVLSPVRPRACGTDQHLIGSRKGPVWPGGDQTETGKGGPPLFSFTEKPATLTVEPPPVAMPPLGPKDVPSDVPVLT